VQPLYAHNRLELVALVVSLLTWRVMETTVDIRSWKRFRAGARRSDRGSRLILAGLILVGIFVGTVLAFKVSGTSISRARNFIFWLGIILMYAGIGLRIYAIRVLGAFFTTTVAIVPEQRVVETGPYRRIRHPSYSGVLMILLGFGLTLTNWLSPLVILGCALIGFSYRIRVEESVLKEQLGQPYQEYMRRTKRLIPFIL